jgi:hypothetical protein
MECRGRLRRPRNLACKQIVQVLRYAGEKLPSGQLGEGHRRNIARRNTAAIIKNDAPGHERGFSRTRARFHEQSATVIGECAKSRRFIGQRRHQGEIILCKTSTYVFV